MRDSEKLLLEEWRDIPGYDGRYQVSNLGRIRSFATSKAGKIIRPTDNGHGYLAVSLHKNGASKMHYVHRLVACAFVPHSIGFDTVNHLDYDRQNNVSTNLEWTTQKENVRYSSRFMRKEKTICRPSNTGEKYISKKRNGKIRVEIKRLGAYREFDTITDAVAYRNEVIANA